MCKVYPGYLIFPWAIDPDFSHNSHQGMFLLKAFYWGQRGVRNNYALQIRNIVEAGYRSLGEVPVLLGEFGAPMDMKFVPFCYWERHGS